MNAEDLENYHLIHNAAGFYPQERGLIAVWGKEAVQFLNGLITNDVAKLEEDSSMLAAFPNAQGRLLAVVRVLKIGGKFLFETEAATREKVFQNLFRFTYAGDFYVEDWSENYRFISVLGNENFDFSKIFEFLPEIPTGNEIVRVSFGDGDRIFVPAQRGSGFDLLAPKDLKQNPINDLWAANAVEINADLYEILRIERGIPLYGVDMDDATIVPELGLENLISYNKGCYIGQEIIARIHFRGHVAKQLTGLVLDENATVDRGDELKTADGKNAGRITSVAFSPRLAKKIALGYVRYDYLAEGTELKVGEETATVKNPPFAG
ncbi:MAG TPA: glycine cleavage T C-terminal barrel domain-containing protein [Pyrinomonadaceae bacterium]|jgi:aminomethyltransferase